MPWELPQIEFRMEEGSAGPQFVSYQAWEERTDYIDNPYQPKRFPSVTEDHTEEEIQSQHQSLEWNRLHSEYQSAQQERNAALEKSKEVLTAQLTPYQHADWDVNAPVTREVSSTRGSHLIISLIIGLSGGIGILTGLFWQKLQPVDVLQHVTQARGLGLEIAGNVTSQSLQEPAGRAGRWREGIFGGWVFAEIIIATFTLAMVCSMLLSSSWLTGFIDDPFLHIGQTMHQWKVRIAP